MPFGCATLQVLSKATSRISGCALQNHILEELKKKVLENTSISEVFLKQDADKLPPTTTGHERKWRIRVRTFKWSAHTPFTKWQRLSSSTTLLTSDEVSEPFAAPSDGYSFTCCVEEEHIKE